MYDVTLFIKHLDSSYDEENAVEVIQELIEGTSLTLEKDSPELKDNKYELTNSFEYKLSSKGKIDYYEFVKKWCSDRNSAGWLRVTMNENDDETLHYRAQVYTRVSELSIGNFIDSKTYRKHIDLKPKHCKRMILDFEHDMKKVTCYIITDDEWYRLLFEYRSVEGFVVGDIFHEDFSMYLPIRNPPKVWKAYKFDIDNERIKTLKRNADSELWEESKVEENILKHVRWYRHNAVSACKSDEFGRCSVFQFCIGSQDDDNSHTQVIAGFIKHSYVAYFSPIEEEQAKSSQFRSNIIEKLLRAFPDNIEIYDAKNRFAVRYGLLMLVSKGTRLTDKLEVGSDVFKSLESLITGIKHETDIEALIKSFDVLCQKLDKRRFIDIPNELDTLFKQEKERLNARDSLGEKALKIKLFSIRRITITPTRIMFQPPELNTSNRVIREFDHDNFVRVSFRDEDFGPLNLNIEYDRHHGTEKTPIENSLIKRISDLFHNGIQIGDKGRNYRFLGCSNSQLRSSGAWFVSESGSRCTVDKIRAWIGDFSQERCLAKYVARLGQAFTTTESSLIQDAEENLIDDIVTEDGKYTFSDGIGRISKPIAVKIKEDREMEYLPSAFQIRYGGCKGMVAYDPTLDKSRKIIQVRPSMKKFESNHKDIEYCKASKPNLLYMNRQVIWLLRGYLVKEEAFINLQNDTLIGLANSLMDPDEASRSLMDFQGDGIFKRVLDSGIDLTQEPFHRLQLLALYRFHVKEVLDRTRIKMPADIGRQMLGVMDETGTLEYGQVFVQYSPDIAAPGKDLTILKRKLFITKNPCVHPGDLKSFIAVDVPQLHHMFDVVVFPQKGRRPHPSELSGSDLDGDEYFVCWSDSLHPRISNKEPGDYEAAKTQLEPKAITSVQLTNQVVKHITKPNNLGKISNAHAVHCDRGSVDDPKPIELAKQHSIAVDYPKTGVPENFSKELKVYEYPDWMEKPDKPCYKSTSVVGNCYRICRSLAAVLGEQDVMTDMSSLVPEPMFLYAGFEPYMEEAVKFCKEYNDELDALMNQYGIDNEGDIACGCLNTVKLSIEKDKKKNYDITEECVRFYRNLQTKFQKRFFEQFDTQKGEWMEKREIEQECYKKAAAWYLAAYKYVQQSSMKLLSFPWCVSEVLCELVKARKNSGAAQLDCFKQESCSSLMIKNMTQWFTSHLSKLEEEPPSSYTEAREKMETFVESYMLREIGDSSCGLPFNPNLLMYLCTSEETAPLIKLQQDMFESYPGWDKSYLHTEGVSEVYLSLRNTPNICVFFGTDSFRRLYTVRRYLSHYPHLQVPSAVIMKWVQTNSLDNELHVLAIDFLLLFFQVLVQERTIDPIKIDYPAKGNPKEEAKVREAKEKKSKEYYVRQLSEPVSLIREEQPHTSKLYLDFLKSIIYCKASADLTKFNWIPPDLKEMNMTICSILSSQRTKFVSYAMREYHETCYFLFNKDLDGTETSRRRGKRNKIAKYKPGNVYPVCLETDLCARYLQKHSNLEVNMRFTNMQRDEIVVIEAWGNTPEVLQDVIDSMIFPREPKLEPSHRPFFLKTTERSNRIPETLVDGSHNIFLGKELNSLLKNVTSKDRSVIMKHFNGEGHKGSRKFHVVDLPKAESAVLTFKGYLKRLIGDIQKRHNLYAHGPLSATCEFGRFDPYLNCFDKENNYLNTMNPTMDKKEFEKLKRDLNALGFKRDGNFFRIRYRYVHNKSAAVTLHLDLSANNKVELSRLSWANMTWCDWHVMNERHAPDDRHAHRDLIFRIESAPHLSVPELRDTKYLKKLDEEVGDLLRFIPPDKNGYANVELTSKGREQYNNDGEFRETITENVENYVMANSTSSRLSKVTFELVHRTTFTYRPISRVSEDLKRIQPKRRQTDHLIARLPHFDALSLGLLNEFSETCTKLR